MKVEIIHRSESRVEECDYRSALDLTVISGDNVVHIDFYDGEPEDNSMSRNFSSIYSIAEIIKVAHQAGLDGQPLEVSEEDSDEL
jgi:hypothetical protein